MKKLIIDKPGKILANKNKLESELNVKIQNRGREFYISGNPEDEYLAEKVLTALEFGFPLKIALLIKEDDFLFEIINIKSYTKKENLERIRGRIIGTEGKALRVLNELTKCFFELKDNQVGIIGESEYIKNAEDAIKSIVHGSKHSNVYAHLEKSKPEPILDFGLKKPKKTKRILKKKRPGEDSNL